MVAFQIIGKSGTGIYVSLFHDDNYSNLIIMFTVTDSKDFLKLDLNILTASIYQNLQNGKLQK